MLICKALKPLFDVREAEDTRKPVIHSTTICLKGWFV